MPHALVALGANLGNRAQTLQRAVARIAQDAAGQQPAVSRMHETSPVGGPTDQKSFLNAAVAFETMLTPAELHAVLKRIELDLGRVRGERWGARAIDLDLLLYDQDRDGSGDASEVGQIVMTPELQVPHPRMSFRRFVLEPAMEVAPEMIHPIIGWSVEHLVDHLNHAAPHVMVLGLPASRPVELAEAAVARLGTGFCVGSIANAKIAVRSDPSGPATSRPIQFLDRIASVLADPRWPAGETVVSAYCVDQLGATERSSNSPPQPAEVTSRLKLLIVLDDWEALVAARSSLTNLPEDADRRELLRLAVHDYQGPVLCAGRTGFDTQLNEITAALVAMQ